MTNAEMYKTLTELGHNVTEPVSRDSMSSYDDYFMCRCVVCETLFFLENATPENIYWYPRDFRFKIKQYKLKTCNETVVEEVIK